MIAPIDFVCLSHLRWNFVYQRPNHLMSRAAREHRVFFYEEPMFGDEPPHLETIEVEPRLFRVVPHLPRSTSHEERLDAQRRWLDQLMAEKNVKEYLLWYYTPMALEYSRHLSPAVTVFDCMDELSGFAGAPPALKALEAELMKKANVVFTGGQSIYEAKRDRHANIHAFPSSVDVAHFARARTWLGAPPDQASVPRPRLGYFGVIDERMDLAMLSGIAEARPDWQIMMIGPLAKIEDSSLPRAHNIHWLGMKKYEELPAYLAGWDVALMPFAMNDATKFISPTKTPEYLAAGKPVVSTPIRDVIRPYGDRGLVKIAGTVDEQVQAIEATLESLEDGTYSREPADAFLATMSWDTTWRDMLALIEEEYKCSTI